VRVGTDLLLLSLFSFPGRLRFLISANNNRWTYEEDYKLTPNGDSTEEKDIVVVRPIELDQIKPANLFPEE
jgi:hypothetical protein